MKAIRLAGWRPVLTALIIWFAHFMLCWVAAEMWPRQWQANAMAWALTALAMLILGVHWVRLNGIAPGGELTRWTHRFGQGAIAIATVAVLFSAVPSFVLLP
jgi:hypothetical protein